MADPNNDPVALGVVAGSGEELKIHGAARLRGYVRRFSVAEATVARTGANNTDVTTPTTQAVVAYLRIYTSSSFDHWIEVPEVKVLYKTAPRESDEERSLVWVPADTVVTQGHTALAANVAASMEIGGDPSTYPGGSGP